MARIKQCLGIDIGTHSIRIAELAIKSEGLEIRDLIEEKLDVDPGLTDVQRQAAIAGQINGMLKEHKIKTRHAVFCVSGQMVFIRQPKIPATTPERLHRIIHFEAKEQIPFPLEQTSLEYQVFESENPNEVEVLLVAMRKDHVDAFMKLVRKTGLKPLAISVSSLALHNFHEVNAGPKDLASRLESGKKKAQKKKKGEEEETPEDEPDMSVGLEEILAEVNLGATMMDLAIPKAGPRRLIGFTRTVPAAGSQIDRAIRQRLNLSSLEQAVEIKEQQTAILSSEFEIAGDPNAVNMQACQAATQVVNSLIAEIRRSLDYFISQPDGVAVDGIVLSGGLAKMPFLDTYAEEKMGIPVQIASIKNEAITVGEELKDKVSAFAIPIGLALQGVGVSQIGIDFLPQDVKNVRAFAENRIQLAAAVLILILSIVLSLGAGQKYIDADLATKAKLEEMIASTERQSGQLKAAEQDNSIVFREYSKLAKLRSAKTFLLDFCVALIKQRPPEIVVERLEIRNDGQAVVVGYCPQRISVNQFLSGLESDPNFFIASRIDRLGDAPENKPGMDNAWAFTLRIATKSRAGRHRPIREEEKASVKGPAGGGAGAAFNMKFKGQF